MVLLSISTNTVLILELDSGAEVKCIFVGLAQHACSAISTCVSRARREIGQKLYRSQSCQTVKCPWMSIMCSMVTVPRPKFHRLQSTRYGASDSKIRYNVSFSDMHVRCTRWQVSCFFGQPVGEPASPFLAVYSVFTF